MSCVRVKTPASVERSSQQGSRASCRPLLRFDQCDSETGVGRRYRSLEVVARLHAVIVRHALSLLDNPSGPRVEQRLSPAGVRHAAMHARSARRCRVNRERAADGGDAVAHVRDPRTDLRLARVKPRA